MIRLVLGAAALACISAAPAFAESRALTGFNAVDASGRLFVEVSLGPQFSVDIEGPRTERVIARVEGETLVLRTRDNWFHFGSGVDATVRVVMPSVAALESSGGVDLVARNINTASLSLDASSGSDLRVEGTCGTLRAESSSGADLHARGLLCDSVHVSASSGSDASVHARVSATAEASSGADVYVGGEGRLERADASSGGDVHH